jgi:hypothetical protein
MDNFFHVLIKVEESFLHGIFLDISSAVSEIEQVGEITMYKSQTRGSIFL